MVWFNVGWECRRLNVTGVSHLSLVRRVQDGDPSLGASVIFDLNVGG